jgi:hypothetical protein
MSFPVVVSSPPMLLAMILARLGKNFNIEPTAKSQKQTLESPTALTVVSDQCS